MKKGLLISFAVILVLALVGVWFLTRQAGVKMESVLPQNPLLFIKMDKPAEQWQKLSATPFWNSLGQVNWGLIANSGNAGGLNPITILQKQLQDPAVSQNLKRFFGKETAIVVYPPKIDVTSLDLTDPKASLEFIQQALASVYIVTRVGEDVKVGEFAARFFDSQNSDMRMNHVDYKKHTVHLFSTANSPLMISVVRFGDILVLGAAQKAAEKMIDGVADKKPMLSADLNYKKFTSRKTADAGLVGYWDMERTFTALEGHMLSFLNTMYAQTQDASQFQQTQKQMDEFFKSVKGFQAIAVSTSFEDLLTLKFDFYLSVAAMLPELASFYTTCRDVENSTLAFIPKDILGYQWSNCLQLQDYWKQTKEQLAQAATPNADGLSKIQEFEQAWGLSIEQDIIPIFGAEAGGYLSDLQMMGPFPIPKLLLFVEIADRAKAQVLLAKLTQNPMMALQKEAYDGEEITFLNLPLGGVVAPGYAFYKDYFFLTTDKQMIKDAIDTGKDASRSLAKDLAFQSIDRGLSKSNSGIQYVRFSKLSEQLKSLADWGNSWVSARDEKHEAFISGTQERLEVTQSEAKAIQIEINSLIEQSEELMEKVKRSQAAGADVAETETQLAELKSQIVEKEKALQSAREQEEEIAGTLKEMQKRPAADTARRDAFFSEIVMPIINSLKAIDVFGAKTNKTEQTLETTIFMNLAK